MFISGFKQTESYFEINEGSRYFFFVLTDAYTMFFLIICVYEIA